MLFRSKGPQRGFGTRLKTAFQRAKFLIVRTPTREMPTLTLEILREKPKYDEFTNFSTWPARPGSASIGAA